MSFASWVGFTSGTRRLLQSRGAKKFIAVATGAILLGSAVLKSASHLRSPHPADGSWVQSGALQLLSLLLGVFALVLIFGLWPRRAWYASLVLFSLFAVITAVEALEGRDSCGCFGAVEVRPLHTMYLDLIAVVALLLTGGPFAAVPRASAGPRHRLVAVAVGGFLWIFTLFGIWLTRPAVEVAVAQDFGATGNVVVLEPENWVRERFSLSEHTDSGSKLLSGRWVVLLVHHDCDHCASALPRYEAMAAMGHLARLAVIEMPPYAVAEGALPTTAAVSLTGKLDTSHDWFATTPVAVVLSDGTVQQARDGEHAMAPDPAWFLK